MSADPPAAVREPKQARSRDGWERVLEVGVQLLEEGGLEALTITEVCRRSAVSPPSLYARVDGKAGLFAAVYERGMERVRATEDEAFDGLPRPGTSPAARARAAAAAAAAVFEANAAFLRPVIGHAGGNPSMLRRGAQESRRLLDRIAAAADVREPAGTEIARTVYAECVVRTMYGADFFSDRPEPIDEFRDRLGRTAAARATSAVQD